jgi:hypothetical protein
MGMRDRGTPGRQIRTLEADKEDDSKNSANRHHSKK